MKIAIVNGPNLNLLGKREPDIYGATEFIDFLREIRQQFSNHEFEYFQSNIEGELITAIQNFGFFGQSEAIVLNCGGYSHTSVAIADSVKASKVPVISVHISNIQARENFRQTDLVAAYSTGSISGLGLDGYRLAILNLLTISGSK
jgi:3-dehydroquinate dehydratase II